MNGNKRFSKIANNYPSFQDIKSINLSSFKWLKSRQIDDKAEGLWRIHNTLYDLSSFIESHPGGSDWIAFTKGTDITEAFETHHINFEKVQSMLQKYEIREASEVRNFKLTFKDTGFYRTLRRRVVDKLKTIDRKPEFKSKLLIDSLLISTFVTAILAAKFSSSFLMILSSLCLNYTVISAHNFFHQRDNFRMLYFNISFLSYREWRISHAMSHHLYPNSLHDMEISFFDPFLCWIPSANKKFFQRYASWVYSPIVYSSIFLDQIIKRVAFSVASRKNHFCRSDLIPFSIPLAMFAFGCPDIILVMKIWLQLLIIGSFFFGFIGLNAGHHHPDLVHDGDELREDLDWGIYSMDTVIDVTEFKNHHFLAMTHFGHHALHHLLPTLDHGVLDQLYPILFETMAEFEVDLETYPWYYLINGQLRQLARNKINPHDSLEKFRMKQRDTQHKKSK